MDLKGRHKVGLLVPAINDVIEWELWQWRPQSLTFYVNRLYQPVERAATMAESVRRYREHVQEAARLVALAKVELIVFACTSGSFVEGLGYDREIAGRITDVTGLPAITTSTAVVEALRQMGMRRLAVATPYPDDVNECLRRFLTDSGFDVVSLKATQDRYALGGSAYEVGMSTDWRNADGIFVSCTSYPTSEALDTLERDTGKPVVSSNQATLWLALRTLGSGEVVPGAGQLLMRRAAVVA